VANGKYTIQIVFDRFPQLAREYPERASDVVRKAAFDIEGRAKDAAPVDTGNLRNSIRTEVAADGLSAVVGTHVEYAIYQEYGTYKMAAHPYMRPAADAVRPSFIKAVEDALK